MMTFSLPLTVPMRIEIRLSDPLDKDRKLNQAVDQLIPLALEKGHGIAVIRYDPARYAVEVRASIPCGTTREEEASQ